MTAFLSLHWLDILTTFLGLIYIVLEYRASIYLWAVGILMPLLDVWLYYTHGLYGDAGMAVYYTFAALYGFIVWRFGRKHGQQEGQELPITLVDAFTNALSFVGLWALARKYIEQWGFWIVVDVISCYLYIIKGIPFKAGLYGLYVVIAVAGYCKWKRIMHQQYE